MRLDRAGIAVLSGCVLAAASSAVVVPAEAAAKPTVTVEYATFYPADDKEHPVDEITVTVSYRCAKGTAKSLIVYAKQTSPEPENGIAAPMGESGRFVPNCNGEKHTLTVDFTPTVVEPEIDEWRHPGGGEAHAILEDGHGYVVAEDVADLNW